MLVMSAMLKEKEKKTYGTIGTGPQTHYCVEGLREARDAGSG